MGAPRYDFSFAVLGYSEIAEQLGLHRSTVEYIEKQAFKKLRRNGMLSALRELARLKRQRDLARGFNYPEPLDSLEEFDLPVRKPAQSVRPQQSNLKKEIPS